MTSDKKKSLEFPSPPLRYLSLSESFERKFSPIWSLNVGEYILDLNSHQISK